MIRSKRVENWFNRYTDYMPLWARDSDQSKRRFRGLTIIGVSLLIVLLISVVWMNVGGSVDGIASSNDVIGWRKPEGLQVVALVFYGRRANVQILERYLRKNLVDNGGILDRVHFVSQVRHEEDGEYLIRIIESNPSRYTYRDFGMMQKFGNYTGLWDHDIDPDTIYVKIDDDILFISDNAIADLVRYKLSHPQHYLVSANIINHPRLTKVHSWFMATLPFAPDPIPLQTQDTPDWRVSTLPSSSLEEVQTMADWPEPPEFRHRWLPMRNATIDDCPMRAGLNCSGRPQWECAAIGHMTLFAHLENSNPFPDVIDLDNERIYDFGVWDFHGISYDRWSINFFVVWGREIIEARPVPEDDEQHFSSNHPKALRKHCVAVGSALASHFSYYWQDEVGSLTDIRERYRALVVDRLGGGLIMYDY